MRTWMVFAAVVACLTCVVSAQPPKTAPLVVCVEDGAFRVPIKVMAPPREVRREVRRDPDERDRALAGGLLAIEYFIRLRERSLWKPPSLDDDNAP